MRLGAMRLLAAFFGRTVVLGLHLDGNRETRGIIMASDLACMKPYGYVQGWVCTLLRWTLS
jgi:hypothetical protein